MAERALQDLKAGDPEIATLDARLSELLKGDAPDLELADYGILRVPRLILVALVANLATIG